MISRMYLRASTNEQDAGRAREQLESFAAQHKLNVVDAGEENESGATLKRPELFRLLRASKPGDVLLIEQIDRLTRLSDADWQKLKAEINARQVMLVSLDLPTSHMLLNMELTAQFGDFVASMIKLINGMLLDVLALVSRKDYEDRRSRQLQGQAKAKAEGRYKGRPEDAKRNAGILAMLKAGSSWTQIQDTTGCGRATIAKLAKRLHAC